MTKIKVNKRSFISTWLYRLITTITVTYSFFFFQIIGTEYLDAGLYSGWVGLAGAIGTILAIRIALGSFKAITIIDDIKLAENDFNKNKTDELIELPRFEPTSRAQINSIQPQNVSNDPIYEKTQQEIDLVVAKEEKLEGLKDFMDQMDPRLYETLKRRYGLEKKLIEENIETKLNDEKKINQHQKFSFSETSAMKPAIIDLNQTKNTKNSTDNRNLNDSSEKKDENYNKLLYKFMKLDNLLSTRLEIMKTRKSPSSNDEQSENSNNESVTIESVI